MIKLADFPLLEYSIDFEGIQSAEEIHARLRDGLITPAYTGNNLDALYDYLTSLNLIRIVLHGMNHLVALGDYGLRTAEVFQTAAAQNRNLWLVECKEDHDLHA